MRIYGQRRVGYAVPLLQEKLQGLLESETTGRRRRGMKAILTKKQVEMLLEGKSLTYGRISIVIPKDVISFSGLQKPQTKREKKPSTNVR